MRLSTRKILGMVAVILFVSTASVLIMRLDPYSRVGSGVIFMLAVLGSGSLLGIGLIDGHEDDASARSDRRN